jgi:hypothetical protein
MLLKAIRRGRAAPPDVLDSFASLTPTLMNQSERSERVEAR